tara:strand:- start:1082 stop:1279 length:198 start_codon:yes stop_codon:yes gene_type:complete
MFEALTIMNFVAIVLLVIVSFHVYLQLDELKEYDEANEKQLQNLVNDINNNNDIISNNIPNIANM